MCIYILIFFILLSLLHVSTHSYHPQGVPNLYCAQVPKLMRCTILELPEDDISVSKYVAVIM